MQSHISPKIKVHKKSTIANDSDIVVSMENGNLLKINPVYHSCSFTGLLRYLESQSLQSLNKKLGRVFKNFVILLEFVKNCSFEKYDDPSEKTNALMFKILDIYTDTTLKTSIYDEKKKGYGEVKKILNTFIYNQFFITNYLKNDNYEQGIIMLYNFDKVKSTIANKEKGQEDIYYYKWKTAFLEKDALIDIEQKRQEWRDRQTTLYDNQFQNYPIRSFESLKELSSIKPLPAPSPKRVPHELEKEEEEEISNE